MSFIMPNWHPIFVHFSVGLLSTAVIFYSLAYLTAKLHLPMAKELEVASRWCLGATGCITVGTVLAGLSAYDSVRHDVASLNAMNQHSNWALPTGGFILLLTFWSWRRFQQRKAMSPLFLMALLFAQGLLVATAWRGGELVFRYGLGVMSLPQPEKWPMTNVLSDQVK